MIESARVFEEMTEMPDEGIPESLIADSFAVVIIPSTIQAGFVFGAKHGQGVMVVKEKQSGKWSTPAIFDLTGASFGWQIGGEAIDIVLLVMSERGLEGLLASKFKLGADASVAAGPVGREAAAATDLQLKGGILSYSRSRGLFAGLKLEGTVLAFNKTGNRELYGADLSVRDILLNGKAENSEYSERLLNDLSKY